MEEYLQGTEFARYRELGNSEQKGLRANSTSKRYLPIERGATEHLHAIFIQLGPIELQEDDRELRLRQKQHQAGQCDSLVLKADVEHELEGRGPIDEIQDEQELHSGND